MLQLERSFKKFYGRQDDFSEIYKRSVKEMARE